MKVVVPPVADPPVAELPPASPGKHRHYGGPEGRSGKGLVMGLATLLLLVMAWKGWQLAEGDVSLQMMKAPARTMPAEPLLEGLDALQGPARDARLAALVRAIDCCDKGSCEGVDAPERVRQRPSLAFREAAAQLRELQAQEARP